jgi:hypothetical protein
MRRRDLLVLPVMGVLPAPPEARLHRLRLTSAEPLAEIDAVWAEQGWPVPVRVVARARPGWWPAAGVLPDGWRAWVDLPDGAAVVVERPARATAGGLAPEGKAARALAAALTAGGSWPA